MVPDVGSGSKDDDSIEGAAPGPKRRRSQPLKVANQIPQSRRKEIEKALEDAQGTPKRWSRKDGPKYHRFLRKRIGPGKVRPVSYTHLTLPTICSV